MIYCGHGQCYEDHDKEKFMSHLKNLSHKSYCEANLTKI